MTEKELIKGCIQEDRYYQQELFRRYAGKMLVVCMRYARHEMEAEDLLQDAFIKVFDNLNKFEFKGSFEGWVRRIVINTALKNYSKKSFKQEQIGLENYPDPPLEPEAYAHLQEEELLRLIAKLPEGYRLVFNLNAIEGYSHKEIADMLGIQESTSRSQLVKARKMLQAMIIDLQKIAV
ncbi:MAG: sigma-70 family RNA polymerase sigma factor [Lewinellaceae bacterium]|nr:sigma-70 family RNA polymerase sigma factor [Phaeodactylibacter sp.]MCB9036937.1 sigma-70 family RNA polymerase sigma factor [Lewinellaceae bacterium]